MRKFRTTAAQIDTALSIQAARASPPLPPSLFCTCHDLRLVCTLQPVHIATDRVSTHEIYNPDYAYQTPQAWNCSLLEKAPAPHH